MIERWFYIMTGYLWIIVLAGIVYVLYYTYKRIGIR